MKGISSNYGALTAEERYRLLLAAESREDEVECDRLLRSATRFQLTVLDVSPYTQAMRELSLLVYIELLDDAEKYFEAISSYDEYCALCDDDDPEDDSMECMPPSVPPAQRYHDLEMASGYLLRARAEGWKLFCEKLGVRHQELWKDFPGYERLQRALAQAEVAAFISEQMLQWLNRDCPTDEAKVTEIPRTAERIAESIDKAFRMLVEWWGGQDDSHGQ